jgi:hypothetical protein
MGSREVSVGRIERHRARRAVAGADAENGRGRIDHSLAVVNHLE